MKAALIDQEGVVNLIVPPEDPNWTPPEGFTLTEVADAVESGDSIIDGLHVKRRPTFYPITQKQIRLALNAIKKLDGVDAAIAAIADKQQRKATEIVWEYGQPYERTDPQIVAILQAAGLNDAAIDDLWLAAINL